jgi:hypothetical protein
VDPVPDPLLLRKSGSAGNLTRTTEAVVVVNMTVVNIIILLDNIYIYIDA